MIAFASYSLQAQDVVVYTHHKNPYKSSTKTSNEKEKARLAKPLKDKHDQIPLHATPVNDEKHLRFVWKNPCGLPPLYCLWLYF